MGMDSVNEESRSQACRCKKPFLEAQGRREERESSQSSTHTLICQDCRFPRGIPFGPLKSTLEAGSTKDREIPQRLIPFATRLPMDIHRQLKVLSASQGIRMQDAVLEAVVAWLRQIHKNK